MIRFQVNLRLSIPSLLYQEAEDGSSTPVLKSIVGLNSPVTIDQCVFQAALLARLVQVLLSSSPDLQTDGIRNILLTLNRWLILRFVNNIL